MARVRGLSPFLPPVFALCAVLASAGCTTVSPQPGAPAPAPSASAPPARTARPDDARVASTPAHRVLATARPDPPAPDARPTARAVPAPAPPRPALRPAVPRLKGPARPLLPTAPDVCGLGETYGGWARGGRASSICHEVYRR